MGGSRGTCSAAAHRPTEKKRPARVSPAGRFAYAGEPSGTDWPARGVSRDSTNTTEFPMLLLETLLQDLRYGARFDAAPGTLHHGVDPWRWRSGLASTRRSSRCTRRSWRGRSRGTRPRRAGQRLVAAPVRRDHRPVQLPGLRRVSDQPPVVQRRDCLRDRRAESHGRGRCPTPAESGERHPHREAGARDAVAQPDRDCQHVHRLGELLLGPWGRAGPRPCLPRLQPFRAGRVAVRDDWSDNYWRQRFASDPGILGKSIRLNGAAFTIVGITPADFTGTSIAVPNVWLPLSLQPLVHPGSRWLHDWEEPCCRVWGRLAPGVGMDVAQAETTLLASRLRALHDAGSDLRGEVTAVISPGLPLPGINATLRLTIVLDHGRGRTGARHCLRQRRRPAAGPHDGPPARARHAHCLWARAARVSCASW